MTVTRQPVLELDMIVHKIKQLAYDGSTFYERVQSGTLDAYYNEVIGEMAIDFMTLPMEREIGKLPMLDDPEEVSMCFHEAACTIGRMFNKTTTAVEVDLTIKITDQSVTDMRTSRRLYMMGQLH